MADHVFARSRQKFNDLVGRRFTRLLVIAPMRRASGAPTWLCRCDCGAEVIRDGKGLKKGEARSCGCLGRRHGHARRGRLSAEYNAWQQAIGRCTNPGNKRYARYSKLGMCAEWRGSFDAFLAHVGPRPSPAHSLHRIDNERGYEIGNVCWATRIEQARNTRRSLLVTHDGVTRPLVEWAERAAVSYDCLHDRVTRLGWPMERALTMPARQVGR